MELRSQNVPMFGPVSGSVAKLLANAFPPSEQYPFPLLVLLARRKGIEFLAWFDGDVFCGFTYLITQGDITYLLYLAVDSSQRSHGYGSAILDAVKARYPGNTVALDIESPHEPCSNQGQRVRRQAFYERNGFHGLGFSLIEHGHAYDILACGRSITRSELSEVLNMAPFGLFAARFTE